MKKINFDSIYNCIILGAIGDSLGISIRNDSYDVIISKYGKLGITDLELDCGEKARVSANTQLTIFTIDALLRSFTKKYIYNDDELERKIIYTNYLRWQYYQDRKKVLNIDEKLLKDNYLYSVQELKYERFPEKRMMDILENGMIEDYEENSDNNNDGWIILNAMCPVGIFYHEDYEKTFNKAVEIAKLTHGHPNAYLSCGVYSVIIASLLNGECLENAIQIAIDILKKKENSKEVLSYIVLAFNIAKKDIHYPEMFDDFGLCDKACQVLSATLYACLIGKDNVSKTLLFCVNNSSYGNNIAVLVGQIFGIIGKIDETCKRWIENIEMKDFLKDMCYDVYCIINNNIPKEIENYDKKLEIYEMKYKNVKNISKEWLIKYDKI